MAEHSAEKGALSANALVDDERARQRARWSVEHDAEHGPQVLLQAARCYETGSPTAFRKWPWNMEAWRPRDPMRNLVKAGALYQAAADACPRRLPFTGVLTEALNGRRRCEEVIDRMLAARPLPPGDPS